MSPAVPAAEYLDPRTGERFPLLPPRWRSDAGAPLLVAPGRTVVSDFGASAAPEAPKSLTTAEGRGVWRYRSAIGVGAGVAPVTLGEGGTPLVAGDWAGEGTRFKLEWFSPTGSFKDRGASVMLTALRDQGVTAVLEDSSGNGGAAVAAYAAAAGMAATIFAPASTSPAKVRQARAFGAQVELVEGPREASQEAAIAAEAAGRGFYASHNWQPFFLEGTKSLAYELWEDLGFRAPDAVVIPVGAGSLLLGCALGFRELLAAGAIPRLPRLYAAQPRNCSPLDAAVRGPEADPLERPVAPTIAEGTAIRSPIRLPELVEAIRESGGSTSAIPEDGIAAAHAELARHGLFAEPTSATALAGHAELVARGEIRPGETTVVVLTGSGLKSA